MMKKSNYYSEPLAEPPTKRLDTSGHEASGDDSDKSFSLLQFGTLVKERNQI